MFFVVVANVQMYKVRVMERNNKQEVTSRKTLQKIPSSRNLLQFIRS